MLYQVQRKLILILFLFVAVYQTNNCQSLKATKLSLNDIESGFKDLDNLRIKLTEQGFKFMQKEEKLSDGYRPEWWRKEDNNYKISITFYSNQYEDANSIQIDVSEALTSFNQELLNNIIKNYPIKKLKPDYKTTDKGMIESGFRVRYERLNSNIQIEYATLNATVSFIFYENFNLD